jgi:hypothetical protein
MKEIGIIHRVFFSLDYTDWATLDKIIIKNKKNKIKLLTCSCIKFDIIQKLIVINVQMQIILYQTKLSNHSLH